MNGNHNKKLRWTEIAKSIRILILDFIWQKIKVTSFNVKAWTFMLRKLLIPQLIIILCKFADNYLVIEKKSNLDFRL